MKYLGVCILFLLILTGYVFSDGNESLKLELNDIIIKYYIALSDGDLLALKDVCTDDFYRKTKDYINKIDEIIFYSTEINSVINKEVSRYECTVVSSYYERKMEGVFSVRRTYTLSNLKFMLIKKDGKYLIEESDLINQRSYLYLYLILLFIGLYIMLRQRFKIITNKNFNLFRKIKKDSD